VALAANPDNGSTLALRCFSSIAKTPDFNAEKLTCFLHEPYPKMPNMALSPAKTKDISVFVVAQRRE
jgi:hypothetical protein